MGIKMRIRHKQTDAEFCFPLISCKGYVQKINSLLEDGLNLKTFSRVFIFDSLSEVSFSKAGVYKGVLLSPLNSWPSG